MNATRRALLGAVSATLVGLVGCSGSEEADDGGSTSERPTASETATDVSTATATPEPTTTAAERDPREVLPRATGEWELIETEQESSSIYGGVPGAGIAGLYEGAGGTRFETVAIRFREPHDPDRMAEEWVCIGYDVAVVHGQWAFATGTGTEQQTFTPEAPPHMEQSPVPGTAARSRELLAQSPLLSSEYIDTFEKTC